MFSQLIFAVLVAVTPQCTADQVTDCHYSDAVSVSLPGVVLFAENNGGVYTFTVNADGILR